MAENRALIPEPITMYTQTESMKDSKDLSKNLMSGEFERQYPRGENKRPRGGCIILGIAVGALAVWLLVLTILREVQIVRLQAQVEELSANMMEMTVNVVSLNTRLTNNRLFNEFKTLEDTVRELDVYILYIKKT